MSNPLANSDVNPLKTDAELTSLLKRLDKVKKYKTFQRWKGKFLDRLESFLYEKGMKPADKAANEFDNLLKKFVKSANKVQDFIEKGNLGESKKSVKASLALNEMCNSLSGVVDAIQKVIPMKTSEEKKRGFTKFHLGAALIRQGFHQYVTMKAIEDALAIIRAKLANVADRQQLDLMSDYNKSVQMFCDVMADLNLYETMLKCVEFLEAPDEEESSDEEPVTITITIDTHDGKKMTLVLDPTDTIGNVKAAIAKGSGIPADKQVLKFKGNNLDKPDATLESCGIVDNSKLTVEPFRVAVTVKTMDGRKIKVMIDPTDYLSNIKIQLEDETGVSAKNQALFLNGKELIDPNKTASEHGIKAGSVLDLEPKTMKVNVKMPDGKTISVNVRPGDSAEKVKAKIEEETGLKAPQQVLKLDGKEIKDGTTMKESGVQDGSDLSVDLFKVPVTVNTYDGKSIKVMIDPSDRLSDIKVQLEEKTGVAAKNQKLSMGGEELTDPNKTAGDYGIKAGSVLDLEPKVIKINVTTPDGKKISVEVNADDTGKVVKDKIAKQTGMNVPQQILKHNGKEFGNGTSIKDMGIKDGGDISVEICKVPITVNTSDGKTIKVMVDPTDKLSAIKKQLEDKSGVPAKNQKLSMDGKELSDDNQTAESYGIKQGSVLELEPKIIKVVVETPDGKKHEIEIKGSDKPDDIKAKIAAKAGIEAARQILKSGGKELAKGKTAAQLGLKDGSEMKVEIFKVPITVNTSDGKKIKVMVDPKDKLSAIKKLLEDKSGVPAKNQKLSMGGKELSDDNKTAEDHGIKEGSVLELEPKIIKVMVETPDGKKHEIEIKGSDKQDDIKAKIAAKAGIAAARQILKSGGKELAKGKTAAQMELVDGSEIKVEIFKVPITVNTSDGKTIKVMVDPGDKLSVIKKLLEDKSGLPAKNQKLSLGGKELSDDNKTAGDHGIKEGSVLELEPKIIKVMIETPDGKKHEIEIKGSDKQEDIKGKIQQKAGIAAARQILKSGGKELAKGKTAAQMGLKEGSEIKVEIFTLPITIKKKDGSSVKLHVEPADSIDKIKKMIEKEIGMDAKKQILNFKGEEVKGGRSCRDCGIEEGSELKLEEQEDKIIFCDCKCGTLFAIEREDVLKAGALSPYQNNKLDFTEAAKDTAAKNKCFEALKASPTLGVSAQVVVVAGEVGEYDLAEAAAVSNVFGVSLKKREKNKKGEEFIFVDPKTDQCGELNRKKYIDSKFIVETGGTLAQRENDNLVYDKYIAMVRGVFGMKEFS